MEYLKITAVLLLLAQAPRMALLQDSTDSPGRTIDKSWLRQKILPKVDGENAVFPEESEFVEGTDGPLLMNTQSDGIASGYMSLDPEEVENVTSEDSTFAPTTLNPDVGNGTTKQQEPFNVTVASNITTAIPSNISKSNSSEAEEGFNSTVTESTTRPPAPSNATGLFLTTPGKNTTQNSTAAPEADKGLKNQTGPSRPTMATTPAGPKKNKTTSASSSTPALPSETSDMSTVTAPPNTPERADKIGKGASSSEKDFSLNDYHGKRNVAWVAVLGTVAAAACVGLMVYILMKKKHQKGFTHRKLVEEYPSDPVLRLDNSEPLDLNFGGSAYYNPGLQGDFIQMSNIR